MRLVLFGPPGAGKGTQSALLCERYRLHHMSTGNLLRAAIKAGTQAGKEADFHIRQGQLVPDDVVNELVRESLTSIGFGSFISDGYPRTVPQAIWYKEFLQANKAPLHAVISLKVDVGLIVERLSNRRIHKLTGENFHLEFNPPPPEVSPDLLYQRDDDRPEAIRKRLDVYFKQTQPVEAFYRSEGILYEIDGIGEIHEVFGRIEAVLSRLDDSGSDAAALQHARAR